MKRFIQIFLILLILLFIFSMNSDIRGEDVKKIIKLQIGNKIAYVDGNELTLDVPPQIINGRTMVPVRFISEGLGAEVGWDGATKTVTITMDSIDYLKSKIKNLEDELTKKDNLIKEKDDKIEELQIKVNNLSNTKVRIIEVTTFKNLVDNNWKDITNEFTSTDEKVYVGIRLEMVSDSKFNLSLNLYDPFNNLVYITKFGDIENKKGERWRYYAFYPIKDYLIGAIPGVWKAKVLVDNNEVGIYKFKVMKDESYKVNKVELIEVVSCKKVENGVPQEITDRFSKENERVIIFTRFKGLINCGFRVKYQFFDPNGNFYKEVFVDMKSLDKDKEVWAWGSIKIKGSPPETNLGEWKCKIYIDDDIIKELTFNIE